MEEHEFYRDIFGDELSHTIGKTFYEFYNYLFKCRKLTERTCKNRYYNILEYVYYYLGSSTLEDLKKISKDSIHKFLVEKYIPSCATGKIDIIYMIVSLNQYLRFLEYRKIIDIEVLNDIDDMAKRKEKYVDMYVEHCGVSIYDGYLIW